MAAPVPPRPIELLDGYRAGACNLGPAEAAFRRRAGIASAIAAALLAAVLVIGDAPALLRLAIALPVGSALLALAQARLRFCAGFAFTGRAGMGMSRGNAPVADPADRAADRRRAIVLLAGVTAASGAIAVAFALTALP